MLIGTATFDPEKAEAAVMKWNELCVDEHEFSHVNNSKMNIGVPAAYERMYRESKDSIIAYLHDDVEIHERGWDRRAIREFDDPAVGVVGFGGGLGHGHPDLYRKPYVLTQLARYDYLSNMQDAETHGKRFKESCDLAVLDGFALIVRRELLDKCGGWEPTKWPPHHLYDYRISAEAHRYGYKVRLVGVACHHRGGETAVSDKYQKWAAATKWGSDVNMHIEGHRLFYHEYCDVMPWRCK